MFEKKQPKETTCEKTQLLMVPMWANERNVEAEERDAFKRHILACRKCNEEFRQTCQIMSLAKRHWGPISEETQELVQKAGLEAKNEISNQKAKFRTINDGWQDLLKKCPDLAVSVKRQKSHRLFRTISSIAACIVIGLTIVLVYSLYLKLEGSAKPTSGTVARNSQPFVKIEQISKEGSLVLNNNQPIQTKGSFKTLLINNKHQVVMNVNTLLSIEPLTVNNQFGCRIKLDSGRIFVSVEKDGNPFIVKTPYGNAVITGTIFDVEVTNKSTTLIVVEGNVRFESAREFVNVAAGQKSTVSGPSLPTRPLVCNAAELTKWAVDNKLKIETTKGKTYAGTADLPLSLDKEPIVLEKTDYRYWVEQKREWFKQQFPYIFQLKDALSKEGIEADYPELLIKTGDYRQFVWMEAVPPRFYVLNPDSLLKTASSYGFDKEWVLKSVPANTTERTMPLKDITASQKAFEKWLDQM